MATTRRCLADGDGCRGSVPPEAPVALCEGHIAAASEWAGNEYGTTDLLPGPCTLCGSRLGVRFPSGWICAVCEWRFGDVVDDELAPPRLDVVYYLRYDDRVKIGTTSNPRQRFSAIWHDDLLALERGDRRLEQHRHAQFEVDRLGRSEWFALSEALHAHITRVAGGVNPWDAYARWFSEALSQGQ